MDEILLGASSLILPPFFILIGKGLDKPLSMPPSDQTQADRFR
jgi:hypothetical protein